MGWVQWLMLGLVILATLLASIQPLEMEAYLLHQVGTVVGMAILLFLQWQRQVSRSAFVLTSLFIVLHILGAHYLYSFVPYNDWFKQWFDFDLNQHFGWSRNMYDRLIHFAYGLLLFKICFDVFSLWLPQLSAFKIGLFVVQFIMASSMVYELIEWLIAIGLSPATAENYNGQQGDIWDAQKDMALASVGAILAWLLHTFITRFK
ncbi:MAG: DUF2238 domain-containing protein [Moraxellaceae bacterium]|nr:MAG: DUF2238 domain-containing protein [Moraxellaceae bacterium]